MCWRLLSQKKPLRICDGPFCAVWGCSVLISGTRAAAWVAGTLHSGITVPRGYFGSTFGSNQKNLTLFAYIVLQAPTDDLNNKAGLKEDKSGVLGEQK